MNRIAGNANVSATMTDYNDRAKSLYLGPEMLTRTQASRPRPRTRLSRPGPRIGPSGPRRAPRTLGFVLKNNQ